MRKQIHTQILILIWLLSVLPLYAIANDTPPEIKEKLAAINQMIAQQKSSIQNEELYPDAARMMDYIDSLDKIIAQKMSELLSDKQSFYLTEDNYRKAAFRVVKWEDNIHIFQWGENKETEHYHNSVNNIIQYRTSIGKIKTLYLTKDMCGHNSNFYVCERLWGDNERYLLLGEHSMYDTATDYYSRCAMVLEMTKDDLVFCKDVFPGYGSCLEFNYVKRDDTAIARVDYNVWSREMTIYYKVDDRSKSNPYIQGKKDYQDFVNVSMIYKRAGFEVLTSIYFTTEIEYKKKKIESAKVDYIIIMKQRKGGGPSDFYSKKLSPKLCAMFLESYNNGKAVGLQVMKPDMWIDIYFKDGTKKSYTSKDNNIQESGGWDTIDIEDHNLINMLWIEGK